MAGLSLKDLGKSAVVDNLLKKGELPTVVARIELDTETLIDLTAMLIAVAVVAVLAHKLFSKL